MPAPSAAPAAASVTPIKKDGKPHSLSSASATFGPLPARARPSARLDSARRCSGVSDRICSLIALDRGETFRSPPPPDGRTAGAASGAAAARAGSSSRSSTMLYPPSSSSTGSTGSGTGTRIGSPQDGHLPRLPASFAATRNALPQPSHSTRILSFFLSAGLVSPDIALLPRR